MVTVIIPTYKRAKYIERAIESILHQTYQEFEIIVVDDNNPETEDRRHMEQIMEKYLKNEKIHYIKHEKNKNGAVARNTGIKIAKGEYISFLDDDDYYTPERLEKMVKILETKTEYVAAYSSVAIVEQGKIISIMQATQEGNLWEKVLLKQFDLGTGSNLFVRTSAIKEINGFNEKFIRHQDIEFLVRLLRNNKIINIEEILVVKNDDDRKNMPEVEKFIEVKMKYMNSFQNYVKELEEEQQKEFYYRNYLEILYLIIKKKDYQYYKTIYEKIENYKEINSETKMKILKTFVLSYINLQKYKRKKLNKKYEKKLTEKIIKQIKFYEKLV